MNQAGCINYLCSDKESSGNGTYFKHNFLSAVNIIKVVSAVGKKRKESKHGSIILTNTLAFRCFSLISFTYSKQ